jgi:uncharacterized protein YqgC (DUF456 family)
MLGEALLFFGIIVLMLLGMIGIIVPILPGIFLIWLGVALYVWQTGFEVISISMFLLMSILVLFAGTSDLWLPYFGAKKSGAAKRSYLLSTIGALVGSFIVPIIGTVVGFVLGLFIGEYWKHQNADTAVSVSWGGLKGWGIATLIQLVAGVWIIGLFAWQVIF